jgi:hypothetical protein
MHLELVQENPRFADALAHGLAPEKGPGAPPYQFSVLVPKDENYFPLLKYKCIPDLKPVPIVSYF